MPKYWGKQIFTNGSFPEVGQKQKTEKKERRANVGNNNGQLRIANATSGGARKVAWANIERKLVITMAKLCMANASTHGARKPPGPKK